MIDTTGRFSALRLRDVLVSRLGGQDEESSDKLVEQVLDRVKVMRAWDFYGVVEAVGEVRAGLKEEEEEEGDGEKKKEEEEEEEGGKVGMVVIDTITAAVAPLMARSQVQGVCGSAFVFLYCFEIRG